MRPVGSMAGAPSGYAEYVPPGYGVGAPRPLLVFLHGSDENGDGSERALQRLARTAVPRLIQNDRWPADRPFIVLMPQHRGAPRSLCADGDEIEEFLAFAVEHYEVDRERVYLTGTSCGAVAAWDYLGQHKDEIVTAAVLIAGDGREAVEEGGCEVGRVAIWAFHGGADDLVSSAGSVEPITALRACTDPPPADLELIVFDGVGHAIWNPIYDGSLGHDVFAWLLEHQNRSE
jgi:predicted peptidase